MQDGSLLTFQALFSTHVSREIYLYAARRRCHPIQIILFPRHKCNFMEALRSILDNEFASAGLKVGIICTDGGGAFDRQLQAS